MIKSHFEVIQFSVIGLNIFQTFKIQFIVYVSVPSEMTNILCELFFSEMQLSFLKSWPWRKTNRCYLQTNFVKQVAYYEFFKWRNYDLSSH